MPGKTPELRPRASLGTPCGERKFRGQQALVRYDTRDLYDLGNPPCTSGGELHGYKTPATAEKVEKSTKTRTDSDGKVMSGARYSTRTGKLVFESRYQVWGVTVASRREACDAVLTISTDLELIFPVPAYCTEYFSSRSCLAKISGGAGGSNSARVMWGGSF
jgi:hypothetical protein